MDLRKLKTMIELVETSGISELEVTEGEERVRIVKAGAPVAQHQLVGGVPTSTVPMQIPAQTYVAAPAAAPVAPAAPPEPVAPAGTVIKSPMVGTFYRAASPGAKVFVDEGETVKEGQTLCVIEAMKIMNESPADVGGVVKQILVQNGQPVEYGQPLFVIV